MYKGHKLTQKFPFLVPLFKSIVPKLLDFTDFPEYRSSVKLLLKERDFQLKYSRNAIEIDQWHLAILDLLSDNLSNIQLERIGSSNDGGYFVPPAYCTHNNWITIGLGSNIDFENDLVSKDCKVISFDPTLPGRPRNLNSNVIYKPLGWGAFYDGAESSLVPLSTLIEMAEGIMGFKNEWNLKFDIEGNEWKCLDQIGELENKPALIVCEIHFIIWDKININKIQSLRKLLTFYRICFCKGNNYSQYFMTPEYGIYDIVEITLIRKDLVATLSTSNLKMGINFGKNNKLAIQMPIGRIKQWEEY